jgi:hypothetical protein
MYARTEGVRRLRSMYRKTSSSAYRMDPSNFTHEGPSPTLRQYRSVPAGIDVISATAFVVRSFIRTEEALCAEPAGCAVATAFALAIWEGSSSAMPLVIMRAETRILFSLAPSIIH